MKVLVTGATGNVGSAVVDSLAADGSVDRIVAVARRRPDEVPHGVEFHEADVGTDDLTPHLDGVDVLVHLAWLFQPTHRPMETWRANAVGTERVLRSAAEARVGAVVHASSVGVYSPGPGDGHFVDESWPSHSNPTAAYGREKAYAERLLDRFEAENPESRVVRLRPAFIFRRGAATSQRRLFMGPFVPNRLFEPGRLPFLPVPAGLRFQVLHTDDVADAYRRAVTGDAHGAFNLAADDTVDAHLLARVLDTKPVSLPPTLVRAAVAAGWHAHLIPAEPHLYDLFMQLPLMETTRARTQLGWAPQRSALEAIEALLAGLSTGAGDDTPPLEGDSAAGRVAEMTTGVGERA
jgi:UDP-glucose 4-epimerase